MNLKITIGHLETSTTREVSMGVDEQKSYTQKKGHPELVEGSLSFQLYIDEIALFFP